MTGKVLRGLQACPYPLEIPDRHQPEAVTLIACPPHEWGHAPTVGYFRCGKCGEQINYDDPRYDELLSERDAVIASYMEERMTDVYRGWSVFYDPSVSTVRDFHWFATHPERTRVHAASRKALETEIDAEEAEQEAGND